MDLLAKLLGFLKENVPWLFIGYEMGKSEENKLKSENIKLALTAKDLLDAQKIKEHNAGLTDDELKSEIESGGSAASTPPNGGEKK